MSTDGARRVRRALAGDRTVTVTRAIPLDDIHVRKGGSGRDVVAYAAVFMTPSEIVDSDGHYEEQNRHGAFERSIRDRRDQIFSVYNHAKSLDGTPSDMWSVPLGAPLDIRADKRGLLTVTRYDPGEANDRILEAIKSGALKGMSYTGVFLKSTPELDGPFSRYQPDRDGNLTLVTREEIALIEYGPTPIPAFVTAEVIGVRAREAVLLNGAGRNGNGSPVHHTEVSVADYHPEAELAKVKFPTSWDHMQSIYALADQAAGDNGKGYMPEHGHLPHHHINDDGTAGMANLSAARQALQKADTIEGFSTDDKQKAKAHLRRHIEDAGGSVQADNKSYPAVVTSATGVSSSGRDGAGERERDGMAMDYGSPAPAAPDTSVSTHGAFTGVHAHNHNAYNGPDDNGDGMHGHDHIHKGDSFHDHDHAAGTPGRAKKKNFDPDNDSDDDSTAAGDTDHDYVNADGSPGPKAKKGKKKKKGGPPYEPAPNSVPASSSGRRDDEAAERAIVPDADDDPVDGSSRSGGVDTSAWDAQKVWSAGAASNDPAAFYRAVCSGRRKGDPKLQSTWALPHHYKPGSPPNAHGVQAALARLGSTQSLINSSAAKAHLEAHERAIQAAKGDTKETSSSGRHPAAVVPPKADASTGPAKVADQHGPQPHPAETGNTSSRSEETMADLMTIDQRQMRLQEVQHRLREIDAENMGAELPADTRNEWTALQGELVEHQRAIKDAVARAEYLRTISEDPDSEHTEGLSNMGIGYGRDGSAAPGLQRSAPMYTRDGRSPTFYNPMRTEHIFDLAQIRHKAHNFDEVPDLMREHAMRALEVVRFAAPNKSREQCQETVAGLLDRVDDGNGTLARRLLVTGSPVYDRAFGKMMGSLSVAGLNSEESRALQLGVDSAGGYAVPFQLDPTVILSSNGAINPLRQISRVEQITGKEWDGVTSAGVVVNRVAEGTEAATGDPLFVQPNVRTTRVQGFVPFNIELDVSWGALRSQMTNLLMDAKDIEEASSFALGNGTAPNANGVVTTLHDQSSGSLVNTAGTATLAIGDLYNLENQMAPRFRQQSAYLASKTTFNRFRQLFQALASAAFDSWVRPSAGTPATFNGYPAYELSTMSNTITSGSLVLLQGDFSQFLIVDRIGMGIELIPHLFGATNRYPVGQRGILAIWFNNSRILVPNAFRLLQVT
jgi:HK97 family phage major capsid protein